MMKVLFCISACVALGALPVFADCPSADLTGDCFVDMADMAVMAHQWMTGNRIPDDMVRIPGGAFQMGDSFGEGDAAERPVHTVTVASFHLTRYQVTNAQYCAFLNAAFPSHLKVVNGIVYAATDIGRSFPFCDTSASAAGSQIVFFDSTFTVRIKGDRDMSEDPMVMVSWYGAAAYCNWRSQEEGRELCYNPMTWECDFSKKGYRLPTEAQWEYAARGGLVGRRFPWGDTISHRQANYYSNNSYSYDISPVRLHHPSWKDGIMPYTSPAGSFAPNGYGLYDMAGNAWDWCNDWWSESYYSVSPAADPKGPATGNVRVFRGGCWDSMANYCRVSYRHVAAPNFRAYTNGFRVSL